MRHRVALQHNGIDGLRLAVMHLGRVLCKFKCLSPGLLRHIKVTKHHSLIFRPCHIPLVTLGVQRYEIINHIFIRLVVAYNCLHIKTGESLFLVARQCSAYPH